MYVRWQAAGVRDAARAERRCWQATTVMMMMMPRALSSCCAGMGLSQTLKKGSFLTMTVAVPECSTVDSRTLGSLCLTCLYVLYLQVVSNTVGTWMEVGKRSMWGGPGYGTVRR